MLVEATVTKVLTSIATKGGYELVKLGAEKIKELFKVEGHEITETQAEKIVTQIQTGDLIQQINNGSMTQTDIESYVKNNESWQQIIHGDNVTGDKISIQNGDYVAKDKLTDNARSVNTGGGDYYEGVQPSSKK